MKVDLVHKTVKLLTNFTSKNLDDYAWILRFTLKSIRSLAEHLLWRNGFAESK